MVCRLLLMVVVLMSLGCKDTRQSYENLTTNYFESRNSMRYERIKNNLSDSFTVVEGSYIMPYSKDSYYEVFQWDSLFHTKYNVLHVAEIDGHVVATVELSSLRNKFLRSDQMNCQFKVSFLAKKISKIETIECDNVNWEIWESRVTTLVEWIKLNHPELNGFIHDMTLSGAKNYLKAVELYEFYEKNL